VAIDRTSKFAFARFIEKANRKTASALLVTLIRAVPCRIHLILTYNGIQFTFPPRIRDGQAATRITHMFDMRCRGHGIERPLTRPNHPGTNCQCETMNLTIKEATVKREHYRGHKELTTHFRLSLTPVNTQSP
jgi:hypothetical protein